MTHTTATSGSDTLYATNGDDFVKARAGNDYVVGDYGNDRLEGDAGDDTLFGGFGNDVLIGGTGSDKFFFYSPNERVDTIQDFSIYDKILISAQGFGIPYDAYDAFSQDYTSNLLYFESTPIAKLSDALLFSTPYNISIVQKPCSGNVELLIKALGWVITVWRHRLKQTAEAR